MKTRLEIELEIYKNMLNVLPEPPEGKRFVGLTYRQPSIGEFVLHDGRTIIYNKVFEYAHPKIPMLIVHFETVAQPATFHVITQAPVDLSPDLGPVCETFIIERQSKSRSQAAPTHLYLTDSQTGCVQYSFGASRDEAAVFFFKEDALHALELHRKLAQDFDFRIKETREEIKEKK